MKSIKSVVNIKIIAFYLVALIVLIFSIPQIHNYINANLYFSEEAIACSSSIFPTNYIKYFGIVFAITAIPAMILYSRFIYIKFGIFITKFHGKFSPELHFKEFISANIQNRIFGISLFVVWLCSYCLLFYGIAAFVRCNILK